MLNPLIIAFFAFLISPVSAYAATTSLYWDNENTTLHYTTGDAEECNDTLAEGEHAWQLYLVDHFPERYLTNYPDYEPDGQFGYVGWTSVHGAEFGSFYANETGSINFSDYPQEGGWGGVPGYGTYKAVMLCVRINENPYEYLPLNEYEFTWSDPSAHAPIVGAIIAPTVPTQVNTAITATANFTDLNVSDTHTVTWNWGDGQTTTCPPNSSQCTITEANGSGTVTGSHTYSQPGVYEVSLRVHDGTVYGDSPVYQYIVVYSPTITKVDGAKEFNSPQTASIPNAGKVEFGFHGDYINNVLHGSASMSFGNTDFTADDLDWIVIDNNNVQLQATGTIKRQSGTYKLFISATDLMPKGQSVGADVVRVKLYNATTNTVVYDSQANALENALPTTTISKGDVQVVN